MSKPFFWAIPSWHGDFRLEDAGGGKSTLIVTDATPVERATLLEFQKRATAKGWLGKEYEVRRGGSLRTVADMPSTHLQASTAEAGALLANLLNYRKAGVITAFAFGDGKVKVVEALQPEKLPRWLRKATDIEAAVIASRKKGMVDEESKALAKVEEQTPEPKAAATVKRPSLSCPECDGKPAKQRMACDVLWEFMDERQRAEWLSKRAITVIGGLTGHAYRVHARDTEAAKLLGRCTFDMDDRAVLHHFLWEVPPEEEVLAIKLFLEHRENWLRVHGEVDTGPGRSARMVFDNPLAGRAEMGI